MKKISIVLINYGDEDNTVECLNSFLNIKKENFRLDVIVVDNFPAKRINIDEKKYNKINLKIIKNANNEGFSGGMNTGIKYSLENESDYVLIQNNDTFVKNDFLQILFDFMEKDEQVGIVSPKIYFAKGYEFHKDRYKDNERGRVIWYGGGRMDWKNVIGSHVGVDQVDNGQFNKNAETDFATGCSMLVSRQVFKKIGLFDENYFLYYEDNDFCQRAIKAGFKIFFVSDSVVWHKNAGSTGGSGSNIQDYFITRNRLYFGMKFGSRRSKIALLKEGLKLMTIGRDKQRIGARDFFVRKMRKGSLNL